MAVVVPESGAGIGELAVQAGVRARAAGFKVPKMVYIVDELPRNTMGKVQKSALREKYSDR